MKKLFAVFIATTILAAPMAQAQSRYDSRPDRNRPAAIERQVEKQPILKKHRWDRGQRLSSAQRRHAIDQRDYRRYKLSAPRRDQRWVRVDNQFLLVNTLTGLIVGLSAAR